eukprot:UN31275
MFHSVALGMGPQTLLTPLESITLVSNTIMAPYFLGETLTNIDIIATLVIMAACVMAVIFGPKGSDANDLDELIDRYSNTAFFALMMTLIGITIIDFIAVEIIQKYHKSEGIVMDGTLDPPYATFLMLSYCFIAAVHGSFNVLVTKSVLEILLNSTGDFGRWEAWMFIFAFAYVNLELEYWKQKALGLFGALFVVPIYQIEVIVGGILLGAVYFEELADLSTLDLIMFFVAIGLTLAGVGILSLSTGSTADNKVAEAFIEKRMMSLERISTHSSTSSVSSEVSEGTRQTRALTTFNPDK